MRDFRVHINCECWTLKWRESCTNAIAFVNFYNFRFYVRMLFGVFHKFQSLHGRFGWILYMRVYAIIWPASQPAGVCVRVCAMCSTHNVNVIVNSTGFSLVHGMQRVFNEFSLFAQNKTLFTIYSRNICMPFRLKIHFSMGKHTCEGYCDFDFIFFIKIIAIRYSNHESNRDENCSRTHSHRHQQKNTTTTTTMIWFRWKCTRVLNVAKSRSVLIHSRRL